VSLNLNPSNPKRKSSRPKKKKKKKETSEIDSTKDKKNLAGIYRIFQQRTEREHDKISTEKHKSII
jgi:hypothetical protein